MKSKNTKMCRSKNWLGNKQKIKHILETISHQILTSSEYDLKNFPKVFFFETCYICHPVSIILKWFEEIKNGNQKR